MSGNDRGIFGRASTWRQRRDARRWPLLAEGTLSADARRKAGTGGRSERGQALVEFALVLPLLATLLLGIVQFGILFNQYITVTDAVRGGARQLSLERGISTTIYPCTDAQNATVNASSGILTSGQVKVGLSATAIDLSTAPTFSACSVGETAANLTEGTSGQVTATFQPCFSLILAKYCPTVTVSAAEAIE